MALSNTNPTSISSSPQVRTIPGAPEKLNGNSNKKKKSSNKNSSNGHGGKNGVNAIDEAAHSASLMEQPPSAGNVDQAVKVQPSDMAEQAESHAALEAVKIVEQNGEEKHAVSALHSTVNKRIKVLNKKLQRAIAYSELTEDKLNSDMRRIVASKGNLEGGMSELSEVLKAIEINEKEQKRKGDQESASVIAKATQSLNENYAKKINTLFQFMYLHSLVNASMQAQFAPPSLPASLRDATSEQVAAVGKLYADLSAAAEVTNSDMKSTLLDKLTSASSDTVLGNITFHDVSQMIEGLSSPVVQQTNVVPHEHEITKTDRQQIPQDQPSILFMQASELEQSEAHGLIGTKDAITNDAPNDVKQAEPEGGAVDGVAASAINGGISKKGSEGAAGTVPGQAPGQADYQEEIVQDGSAKAAVEEPVQTKPVSEPASGLATPSTQKIIDWSAHDDDDDFGDLEMQPEPSKILPSQPPSFSAAVQPKGKHEDSNNSKNRDRANTQRQNGQNARENAKQQKGKNQQQQSTTLPKLAPQVDEDGFTVASSKRTKMLQQQQAANTTRGGRGGNSGKGSQRYNNEKANKSDLPNRGDRGGGGGNGNIRGRGRGRGSSSGNGVQDVPVQ